MNLRKKFRFEKYINIEVQLIRVVKFMRGRVNGYENIHAGKKKNNK